MSYIGIEAGGPKFVLAYGTSAEQLQYRTVIKTDTPAQTLPQVTDYIQTIQKKHPIKGIGIACFGPLQLERSHAQYGFITSTPKQAWQFVDIVGYFKKRFELPIGFDTDVNATALAEHYWGAAKSIDTFIYLTVGTGIGGGAMVNGKLLHGAMHPDMGHCIIQPHPDDDFTGVCPYHHNCLEGMASGPALKERYKVTSALSLTLDHPAWELEADYLAQALANYSYILSPKKIIMGGGVMRQKQLYALITQRLHQKLNGYIHHPYLEKTNYISAPGLGENAGAAGAIALAQLASLTKQKETL